MSGVAGLEGKIDRARVGVEEKHARPVLAAVVGAEDAALRVGAIGVAQCRHENALGIARIDEDAADLARVLQADLAPVLAAVGRFVHPVAMRDVGAHIGLAGADIDRVGVDGTAMAPIEPAGWPSKMGFQVRPASSVSQTPPSTAPNQKCRASPGMPATVSTRPPRNGPIRRHCRAWMSEAGTAAKAAEPAASASNAQANTRTRNMEPPQASGAGHISPGTGQVSSVLRLVLVGSLTAVAVPDLWCVY